jgi:hypothetical protein
VSNPRDKQLSIIDAKSFAHQEMKQQSINQSINYLKQRNNDGVCGKLPEKVI